MWGKPAASVIDDDSLQALCPGHGPEPSSAEVAARLSLRVRGAEAGGGKPHLPRGAAEDEADPFPVALPQRRCAGVDARTRHIRELLDRNTGSGETNGEARSFRRGPRDPQSPNS
ncbi:MAG TPA: hypothetical protein VMV04_17410 [Thermodesulfobacteriota bacterium]|nr:hypothetical protein [Thermodesulfobacteriota bacterium]